jgi:hypothetical protein
MELPLAPGLGMGPATLGFMQAPFPCISARDCFQDLNPWLHGHKAKALLLRQPPTPSVKQRILPLKFKFV